MLLNTVEPMEVQWFEIDAESHYSVITEPFLQNSPTRVKKIRSFRLIFIATIYFYVVLPGYILN